MGLAMQFDRLPADRRAVLLLLRRMSLMGDALSHAVLPGAALGFLVAGFWGSVVSTVGIFLPSFLFVLIVAPMSGHFATLLRGTVKTLLQDHDVYITDWHNPRDIPLDHGRFGLEDYTDHLISFMDKLGPRAHMVAICQPSVSALAAVAIMCEDDHPSRPATLTLISVRPSG